MPDELLHEPRRTRPKRSDEKIPKSPRRVHELNPPSEQTIVGFTAFLSASFPKTRGLYLTTFADRYV